MYRFKGITLGFSIQSVLSLASTAALSGLACCVQISSLWVLPTLSESRSASRMVLPTLVEKRSATRLRLNGYYSVASYCSII